MNTRLAALLPAAVMRSGAGGPADYYTELVRDNFGPGWARPTPSLWPAPESKFQPAVWRYASAKTALDRAGEYVPMRLTERRNLLMVNPSDGNLYATAANLVAAYQMIQPGETADDHRHTPHALRIVLDAAPGVYTVVNGTRVDMSADDIVLTPGGCWHGHACESTRRAYWIDVLDVPLVHHLESMFFEQYDLGFRKPAQTAAQSPFRIRLSSRMRAGANAKPQPVTLVPLGNLLPTMTLDCLVLDAGARTSAARLSASNLFVVLSGRCRLWVEEAVIADDCVRGDVAVVPLWRQHWLEALERTTVLRISDRPVYETLGYFRHEPA